MMRPFVFTLASLIWMGLSFISTFIMIMTLNSAKWIIGHTPYKTEIDAEGIVKYPSLGLDSRCILINGSENCASFAVKGLATNPLIFPTLWKMALIFFTVGVYVSIFTTIAALATCYFQSIYNKSLYNIVGCIQAITGLFFILSIVFYMAGWGCDRVTRLCGQNASPFTVGDCTLGSSFYYSLGGGLIVFVCACISVLVENTTSHYRVNKRIHAGQKLICLF